MKIENNKTACLKLEVLSELKKVYGCLFEMLNYRVVVLCVQKNIYLLSIIF